MAWIEKLHATYEACKGREPPGVERLMPVSHSVQQAHIEITLDEEGNFKEARSISKEETVIPATEKSAGRTSGEAPHPLCDKVQYCASDYSAFGGVKTSYFSGYREQLSAWCASSFSHPKAEAVLAYVDKGTLVADLVRHKVLHLGPDGRLLTQWTQDGEVPELFRQLTPKEGLRDQGDALIRWIVRIDGDLCSEVWKDSSLQEAWIGFDSSANNATKGLCMATGEAEVALASSHPKRIRHGADGAKLISANDVGGFTFRGRFTDGDGRQAAGVSYVTTQKAHSALRWLVKRQAYRNGEQVFVAWTIAGKPIPDPWTDSLSVILGGESAAPLEANETPVLLGDVGQAFARRLRRAIAGYGAKLNPTDEIVVMGLDSATPGRMAIIYYRELKSSEFLERIEAWHAAYAWPQNFGKDKHFTGAPAPHDIAEAVYATRLGTAGTLRLDEKLKKVTVERLLPCIVDSQPLPRDLVVSAVRRASQRSAMQKVKYGGKVFEEEWEKILGIACGLFRGWSKLQGKEYQMALEEERTSRDYLYGRLLAVADNLEGYALYQAKETRETSAARLMQRFADHPFSTWRTIELSLPPYKARLRASAKGGFVLLKCEKLFDAIQGLFASSDFTDDRPLSGEFLLGYHCQRAALIPGSSSQNLDQNTSEGN